MIHRGRVDDMKDKINIVLGVIFMAILLVVVMQPYFEAKSFNRLSEKKVTYWDAMFLNLRVDAR